jgi:hypothetical protein
MQAFVRIAVSSRPSHQRRETSRGWPIGLMILLGVIWTDCLASSPLSAADFYWNVVGPADWNTASNWFNPGGLQRVPGSGSFNSGDVAHLANGGTATIASSPPRVSEIDIGGSGSTTLPTTVNHSSGTVAASNLLILGLGAPGDGVYNQSGGSVNVALFTDFSSNQGFIVGEDLGTSGTYTLSGGTFTASQDSYLGLSGGGTFNQMGNSTASFQNTAGTTLYIGAQLNSNGQYNLADTATLHAYRQEEIGYLGSGTFMQTGGTHTVDQGLILADQSGSSGTYKIQGGTLNANSGVTVGSDGSGTFTQSSGIVNIGEGLNIQGDAAVGASGTFNLKGGTLNVVAGTSVTKGLIYSGGGAGSFNFSGGTLRTLAYFMGSNLTQNASDNPSTLDVTGNDTTIYGGYDINGGTNGATLLVANGHTLTVQNELSVQGGIVTITQTAGAINVGANFDIANGTASGTFNLSGGSISFGSGGFNVADQGGSGTLNLSGTASINASAADDVFLANGLTAFGTVNQTGGTLRVRSAGHLYLTNSATASGIYNLKGGTLDAGAATISKGPGNGFLIVTGGTLKAGTIASDMNDLTQDASDGNSTLDVTGNDMTINVNYTAAVSSGTNTATINVGAGHTLTMAAGKTLLFGNQSTLQGTGTIAGAAGTNLAYGSNLSSSFGGTISGSLRLIKTSGSTLEIDGAPTLNAGSSIEAAGGTLRFNVVSGAPTIAAGITATVSSGATLELAGTVSALTNGSNRVNVMNDSTTPGLLVSGIHQQVGDIDGSGSMQVNAGSDLTANHIIQGALVIGGTAGNLGSVTIDASDVAGNPLTASSEGLFNEQSSLIFDVQFGNGGVSFTSLSSGGRMDPPRPSSGFSAAGTAVSGSSSSVPEPSTLILVVVAFSIVISQRIATTVGQRIAMSRLVRRRLRGAPCGDFPTS